VYYYLNVKFDFVQLFLSIHTN